MGVRIRWPALAIVVTLVAEVVAFIIVGKLIGFGFALLLLLASMALGAVLLRQEGLRAWRRYQSVAAAGERPGPHLTRSLVGLLGALFLLVPGFITDVLGLALFVPPIRTLASRGLTVLAGRQLASAAMGDLFGPRLVKVRAGRPTRTHANRAGAGVATDTETIEGEIVDPR
ncbi:MAG TPA: FxsA family protein [Micromonosporaceae bacterium]